jgi:hypothetical protein
VLNGDGLLVVGNSCERRPAKEFIDDAEKSVSGQLNALAHAGPSESEIRNTPICATFSSSKNRKRSFYFGNTSLTRPARCLTPSATIPYSRSRNHPGSASRLYDPAREVRCSSS